MASEIIKSDRYKEFEDKYTEHFANMLISNGVDIKKLSSTPEGAKALEESTNEYIVKQMRREVNDPTKREFEQANPTEQARIYSQKTGTPFNESSQLVAGFPRNTASSLYDSGMGERTFDLANDALSGLGRSIAPLFSDANPLEEMGTTQGQGLGMSILKDPMTPVGVGLGGAFQGAKPLYGALGRGLGGGATQSTLRSGGEGRLPTLGEVGLDLATNVGGETAGTLLGVGGSNLLKSTGGFAGASGKGAREALEYLKLKPQTPIGPNGLRSPITSNQKQVAGLVGTEAEIGQELFEKFTNFDDYITEGPTIRPMLQKLPDVDALPVLEAMESIKVKGRFLSPEDIKVNEAIDSRVGAFLEQLPSDGKVSAEDLFDLRKSLDKNVDFGSIEGGESMSDAVSKAYRKGRNYIKNELERSAEASGIPEYSKAMKSMHEKYLVKEKMQSLLSKNRNIAEKKSEGFVANLFGKNKTEAQKVIKEFDKITGGNTAEKARLANLGKQVGMEETGLPALADLSTGARLLNLTGLPSPKVQANIVYPMADALKVGLKDIGLGARVADQLKGRANEVLQNSILNTEY